MGMDHSIYVGPYVVTEQPIQETDWSEAYDAMQGALAPKGTQGDFDAWVPNLKYAGEIPELEEMLNGETGHRSISEQTRQVQIVSFENTFAEAIQTLRQYYSSVAVMWGVISDWS